MGSWHGSVPLLLPQVVQPWGAGAGRRVVLATSSRGVSQLILSSFVAAHIHCYVYSISMLMYSDSI